MNSPLLQQITDDMICIYYNAMGLVTATDANQITSVSLTKTFRVEEPVVPELLYCDQVAR